MSKDKFAWVIDIDTMLEVYKLAQQRGKKAGENIEQEFLEVMKKKNMTPVAKTDQDIDMLTGNLREEGMKILNMKEVDRKNEKDNK